MYLGRVVGSVWCTVKNADMTGCRMLIVQPLTPELTNTGKQLICTDTMGAGKGEIVYWVRGKEASFPFLPAEPPLDTTIVGIVDHVHVKRSMEIPPEVAVPVMAETAKPAAPVHRKGSRKA
jgi:microcompartment protein CcmK/EutM